MNKTIALFLAIFCFSVLHAQQDKGWISLFDGKSLTGWHPYKKPGTTSGWIVKDNAIFLDITQKDKRGDLITDQDFGDFDLKFDWKVGAKSNSGLIFMVDEKAPGATWQTGPEFQLLDNTGYPDEVGMKQYAGSLYDLIGCPPEFAKATGEWNSSEIILQKNKLIFIVNDKKVLETIVGSNEWNTLIADSKFSAFKDFAKSARGRIALQDHGGEVWFRNIKIKNL